MSAVFASANAASTSDMQSDSEQAADEQSSSSSTSISKPDNLAEYATQKINTIKAKASASLVLQKKYLILPSAMQ